MYFVYRHIRLDSMMPFYIGIGTLHKNSYHRARTKQGRNNHWRNIVNKVNFKYEIIFKSSSLEEVCSKEKYFIKLYGKNINGGLLCNICDGGRENHGYRRTKEEKYNLRKINSGKNHPQYGMKHDEQWLLNQSISKIGSKNVSSKKVLCINSNKIYDSQGEAALELYGSRDLSKKISDIIHGKRKSYLGYKFKRA